MSYDSEKSAAEIEREISADRERIGEKLSAIQEKLTPGQMMDEALGFFKSSGGADYVGNLGRQMKTNPIPVALMGVSIAWLMAGSGNPASPGVRTGRPYRSTTDYPLATVTGEVRRSGPARSENGESYSHFVDTTGKRFRALTDTAGNRAGHFVDDTGNMFRGFADSTGQRISQLRDETGSLLSDASGWASDTWEAAKETLGNIGESLSNMGGSIGSSVSNMGGSISHGVSSMGGSISSGSSSAFGSLQDQSGRLNDMIMRTFRDQPLVGGAIAFAVGAAIGATLPHTTQEDQLMGDAADQLKEGLSDRASDLMDQGKDVARDVYDKAVAVAAEVHDTAKERIVEEAAAVRADMPVGGQRPTSGLGANPGA